MFYLCPLGTAAVLAREADMEIVAVGGSLADVDRSSASADAPDVLILDVRLGEENGLFNAFDYPQYHHVALCAGAAGFVAKSVETRKLLQAVPPLQGDSSWSGGSNRNRPC
jgi:DNA-binding NarL/FixJ family response regulator